MQNLPQKALRFLILIYLLGLMALLSRLPAVLVRGFVPGAAVWELALFVALAGLAGGKKVYLLRNQAYRAAGNMSLLFRSSSRPCCAWDPARGCSPWRPAVSRPVCSPSGRRPTRPCSTWPSGSSRSSSPGPSSSG